MSRMTSVVLVTATVTAPLVPAGTMAALATTIPPNEFNVEAPGWLSPVGHRVRNGSAPCGTTVTFKEYALAVVGMPHELCGMTNDRLVPLVMVGPPNGASAPRVSATRQGVTGTNRSA